jgi:uncharacterized membrane protein YphA (DoxX/SURF4 family)
MKIVVHIVRIIVGVLFIFSGLVKANDPAGLSYKMHEFFEAWGVQQFNNLALTFSVLMIAFEIIAGFALLVGWQKKWNLWLLLSLIIFFTFLTGYAWLATKEDGSPKFAACGCFGDCIPLKPQESFFKDIVLLVLILFLLFFQKWIQPLFNKKITLLVIVLSVLFSFLIQKYTLDHLPFKDCLAFKVGNNISEKKKFIADSVDITYTYNKDGKAYTYSPPNYPQWALDEDSTYIQDTTKTITKIIKKGNSGDIILDFALHTEIDTDTTEAILSTKGEVLLMLITDIDANGKYSWEKDFKTLIATKNVKSDSSTINKFAPIYIVTNKATEARLFFKKYGFANDHIFFCDEKPLLAAGRTRPTIMVLKDGVIIKKVSHKDLNILSK